MGKGGREERRQGGIKEGRRKGVETNNRAVLAHQSLYLFSCGFGILCFP